MGNIVEFEPNKPVEMALLYPKGKFVDTAHGQRVMFSLVDGRVMFLDPGPAEQINRLGVKPREPFRITMRGSGKQRQYVAELTIDSELRRAQSDAAGAGDTASVRRFGQTLGRREQVIGAKVPEAGGGAPAPAGRPHATTREESQQAADNGNNGSKDLSAHQGWAQFLLSETNALVDVFASAKEHAASKGVSADQVLALMTTAFRVGRSGGPDVA